MYSLILTGGVTWTGWVVYLLYVVVFDVIVWELFKV